MSSLANKLAIVLQYTKRIKQARLEQGLSEGQIEHLFMKLVGKNSHQQLQYFLTKEIGVQEKGQEDRLIQLIKKLEQEYGKLCLVDGDIPNCIIEEESSCPPLRRIKNKPVNLETPRVKKIEERKEARLEVEMKTPSPKKQVQIISKDYYDDLQDTDQTECRYLDNFQKSIQETLERTRKLRKFLDSQLRNIKSPEERLYDFEHYDEVLLE